MRDIRKTIKEVQFNEEPNRALFDEMVEMNEKLDKPLKVEVVNEKEEKAIEPSLIETLSKMLKEIKGDKGDKGDKGEPGKDGEDGRDGLNGDDGKDGVDGIDGKDGLDGKDGKDGAQGPKGDKGDKGDPGKDAIIELEKIVKAVTEHIQMLKGNDRIDISSIRNSEQILGKLAKIDTMDQRWHGGGISKVRDEGVSITDGSIGITTLDFIGAGVNVSYTSDGVAVVSIPGGAGANQSNNETPVGAIDDNNKAYTLAHTPINSSLMLYLNGQLQTLTEDYTLVGSNITFITAPMTNSVLRAFYQY